MHVIAPCVVESITLRCAKRVRDDSAGGCRVETQSSCGVGITWQVSQETVGDDASLNSAQDSGTDSSTQFRKEEDEGSDKSVCVCVCRDCMSVLCVFLRARALSASQQPHICYSRNILVWNRDLSS